MQIEIRTQGGWLAKDFWVLGGRGGGGSRWGGGQEYLWVQNGQNLFKKCKNGF